MDHRLHRLDTRAVHAGMAGLRESGAHVPPIDFSTTYPLPDVDSGGLAYEELATGHDLGAGRSPVYQRLWQPGVARFEDALADLEATEGAVAFASGMAALAACLIASVTAGKPHVVAVRPLYGGTDHVLENGLLGTTVTWATVDEIAAAIRPETGLVIVETPANPTLELVDLAEVVAAAGEVPVLVDNTFATPVLQQPARHGATLVLHSATKYLGGHGDVMGGVVATEQRVGPAPPPGARADRRAAAPDGGVPAAPRTAHASAARARPAADRAGARRAHQRPPRRRPGVLPGAARPGPEGTARPPARRTRDRSSRSSSPAATTRPRGSRSRASSSSTPSRSAASTRSCSIPPRSRTARSPDPRSRAPESCASRSASSTSTTSPTT